MILPHLILQIKFELLERQTHLTSILLLIILFCSALVGAGRINNSNFFISISSGFFKFKTRDKSYFESTRMSQGANIALYLNFITSLSLCFFLMLFKESNFSFSAILGVILVGFLMALQQIGFRVLSVFTGQTIISENGSLITKQIWFFSGILYLLLSLVWLLNLKYKSLFIIVFICILAVTYLLRLLKGLLFAFWIGYSWYYIFLYLCTFEILPVIILNKLIQMYLQTKM